MRILAIALLIAAPIAGVLFHVVDHYEPRAVRRKRKRDAARLAALWALEARVRDRAAYADHLDAQIRKRLGATYVDPTSLGPAGRL